MAVKVNAAQAAVLSEQRSKLIPSAIAMFRPTEPQEEFFRTMELNEFNELMLSGGNRCLAGCQEIYDPVLGTSRRVDGIESDFHVNSVNPKTGETEIKRASKPFVKGFGELWRVTLSNGEVIHVTPEHRVVARDGHWVSIRESWEKQIPLASVPASKSSALKGETSVRNTERRSSQQCSERSSCEPFPARCHQMGTEFPSLPAVQIGEERQNLFCGSIAEQHHRSGQTSRQFLSRSSSSRVRGALHHPAAECYVATLQYPSSQSQVDQEPSERTCGCNRKYPRSLALTVAGRDTFDEDQSRLETESASFAEDVPRCSRTDGDSKCDCRIYPHCDDGKLRPPSVFCQGVVPSRIDAEECTHRPEHQDDQASKASYNRARYPQLEERCLLASQFVSAIREPVSNYESLTHRRRNAAITQRSFLTDHAKMLGIRPVFEFDQSSHPRKFVFSADTASERILSVEHLPAGEIWDICVDEYANYTLQSKHATSVVNANSGKTVCAAVALAGFLLNVPITFRDGTQHHMRPMRWRKEAVKAWLVSFDWDHAGKTVHRLLFKKDAFRVLRDQETGKWRGWDPLRPGEADMFELTKPSPPLISMSDVKGGESGISWENKKEHQLNSFEVAHDGSRVEIFPSTGSVPQGDPVHLIWIDEKIADDKWYSELLVRTIDYRGRLIWTAWPNTAPSEPMTAATDRAEAQNGMPDQTSFAITLKGNENIFTQSKHRDKVFETMDPEEKAARDGGQADNSRWRTYHMFSRFIHRVLGTDPEGDDAIAACIRKNSGIPADWTRYLVLDPGSGHAAVLMVAVPPPHQYFEWSSGDIKKREMFGDAIVPYDEIYIPNMSAKPLSEAVKNKTAGTFFEDFIIDSHASRQTPMGFSGTIGSNYADEFRAAGLRCLRRGSNFSPGSDDVDSRIMKTQGTMNIRGNGKPLLRFHGCQTLAKQLERYRWGQDVKGNPIHKPARYQKVDLAVCLEYFVSRDDCGYVRPPEMPKADVKHTPAFVMKDIMRQLGITPNTQAPDRSVFCGAGKPKGLFE
jgi:hypothetical protein